ncbi:exodeoxyribonuclease VII large subunit [Celeribacter litoreus]|uniref:exodeoxyribonuclease VII large subunit n=1 Tax=Celeribacter litoreus TaxID=2876714 RepID=UPI001CCE6FAF|nr:exodeoxyribonuclease VII large subunit [Celeribacter litoreus]MCA0045199.1 exodeoxyribonuclease VII large subunit [Celeribacter litoreus]
MSELFEDDEPQGSSNAPEFSVSDLTGSIKRTLEGAFGRVRVRGEIGRVMHARSGHYYYDLKDDKNVIACNTWKGQASKLSVQPEEGMEVIVTGRLSTFGPQSKYNLNVDEIEVAGAGALMAMLEKRKKALAAEGLFDAGRKRQIPWLPEVIGVVTSPSGAVIRDILHRLRDRFPRHVLLWPVAVQGQNCAAEVAAGIKGFNALPKGGPIPRPDLIIVARGGGSVEDLWGFNEEIVVRAAAASDIPLISAVGHETDTTLIDFASDRRAPTPTAAAEMAVPVRRELWVTIQDMRARIDRALSGRMDQRRQRLTDLSRALPRPEQLLDGPRQRVDQADARLNQALINGVRNRRLHLSEAASVLRPTLLRDRIGRGRERISMVSDRLPSALSRGTAEKRRDLDKLSRRLAPERVSRGVAQSRERLDALTARLSRAALTQQERRTAALERSAGMLEAMSYRKTLERGYAVVHDAAGGIVTSVEGAASIHRIEFKDGDVQMSGGVALPKGAVKPKKAKSQKTAAPKDSGSGQGSLF